MYISKIYKNGRVKQYKKSINSEKKVANAILVVISDQVLWACFRHMANALDVTVTKADLAMNMALTLWDNISSTYGCLKLKRPVS